MGLQGAGLHGTGLLSLDFQKASLAKALDTLRTYTDEYNITFVHNDLEHLQVTAQATDLTIPEAVERICKDQPVRVKTRGQDIIVKYRPEKDRTIALWGHVRDAFTKRGIVGAQIKMLSDDGAVLDSIKTWVPNNDRDDAVYRFEVPIVQRSYRFVAEHPDYETTAIDYTLRYAARNDFFDLPHTFMPKKTLQLNGGSLGEVVVKATKVQMVYRGDTLVFNADAFNVPEGSMLDALIRQMPGVELRQNGEVYVQGRKVDFLTLNGEDFFRGKNQVLLENLPYYTVKNIEVYEKQTEKSEWLGTADAPKDYVMDIVLKREYSIGYLANLQGGAGTEDRYAAKVFGLRYTDHSRVAVYANANNVNELNDANGNGEWNVEKEQREGAVNMQKAGFSLNINDKDKRWTEHANIETAWMRQHKEEYTSTEHFLATGNEFSRQIADNRYKAFKIGGSNIFTLKKPFWFRNKVEAVYGHYTSDDLARYGRFTQDPSRMGTTVVVLDSAFNYSPALMDVLVNMRHTDGRGSETNWWAEYQPNISYKFLWGDDIDIWGKLNLTGWKQEERGRAVTEGYSSDDRQEQLWFDQKSLEWEAGVQYTIHLHSHWNYRASVGYYHKRKDVTNECELQFLPDLTNTYDYTFSSNRVTPLATVYYQRDDQKRQRSTWFSASVPLHVERQHIDFRQSIGTTRHILLPTPELRYERTYKQGLNYIYLNYNTSYDTPEMLHLVNTHFDADPLHVRLGNPDLKNAFSHRFVVNYKIGQKAHNQYIRFDGGLNITQNKLVNGQTYDPKTGITYWQHENVNGNWDCWGQLSFGRMLDAKKRLWIETRTNPGYGHNVSIAALLGSANRRSIVNSWNFSQYALLRYKLNKLTASGYIRYATSWNRYKVPSSERSTTYEVPSSGEEGAGVVAHKSTFHPTTTQYGLSAQYEIPILRGNDGRGLQVATDAVLHVKRGYGDSSLDTNDFVWNATVAKSLLKNRLVVKLEGFDILNQLSNIYSTIDAQGRVETWRNMVPSYLMLHLEWHFSRMPGKSESNGASRP